MSTHINLLDWRAARREKRKKEFAVTMVIGVLIAAAIVGAGWLYMDSQVNYQQARNNYLRSEIKEMDKKIKEIQDLERVRANLLARIKVIEELQASRTASVHFFDEIVNTLPDGVSLNSIKQQGNNVTIDGAAESNGRVSTYMKNLDASAWFKNPHLIVIKTDEKNRRRIAHFTLRVVRLIKPKESVADDDAQNQDGSDDGEVTE